MSVNYPPYVNAYGNIEALFKEIKRASVPPKFTQDFLSTVLGLKSSSYRAMIPLLKKLGLVDSNNVPTQAYRDFRDDDKSGHVLAERVREAYASLFAANEYAYKLSKQDVASKLRTVTGAGDDDKVIPAVAGTFLELIKHAKFDSGSKKPKKDGEETPKDVVPPPPQPDDGNDGVKLGISYTINLNLPATTEIEVFNAIFKSLKEHILTTK